jgi:protoporphyrin/coproporphyrin ferrochelatase
MSTAEKLGIVLLNLGGPDTQEAVKPFLYNLFSDPEIINLPLSFLTQKPFAWLISTLRNQKAKTGYAAIGGGSPILRLTQQQADLLQAHLQQSTLEAKVYIAMRYWKPFTDSTVEALMQDGVNRIIALPLYPQYSLSTTASSYNELQRCLKQHQYKGTLSLIPYFHTNPLYLQAMAETIQHKLDTVSWSCPKEEVLIAFSAHSLPEAFVKKTSDIYPQQIAECTRLIIQHYFPRNPWALCLQSKVGPVPWLEPSTEQFIEQQAHQKRDNLLFVPISFVSDHIETLFEIDQEYLPLAKQLGLSYCARADGLNDSPTFIAALAQLIQQHVAEGCVQEPVLV